MNKNSLLKISFILSIPLFIYIIQAVVNINIKNVKTETDRNYVISQIKQITLAVEHYKHDYSQYPLGLINLNGENLHKKVYYKSSAQTIGNQKVNIDFDDDGDNAILINGNTYNKDLLVWVIFGDEIITSESETN